MLGVRPWALQVLEKGFFTNENESKTHSKWAPGLTHSQPESHSELRRHCSVLTESISCKQAGPLRPLLPSVRPPRLRSCRCPSCQIPRPVDSVARVKDMWPLPLLSPSEPALPGAGNRGPLHLQSCGWSCWPPLSIPAPEVAAPRPSHPGAVLPSRPRAARRVTSPSSL